MTGHRGHDIMESSTLPTDLYISASAMGSSAFIRLGNCSLLRKV